MSFYSLHNSSMLSFTTKTAWKEMKQQIPPQPNNLFFLSHASSALRAITTHRTWTSTGSCATQAQWSPSTWSSPICCKGNDCRRCCLWTTAWRRWFRSDCRPSGGVDLCTHAGVSFHLRSTTCWLRRASWKTPTSSTPPITATTSDSLDSSKVKKNRGSICECCRATALSSHSETHSSWKWLW